MLSFLVNIVEQIDLAKEHVAKGDANNARFGLVLIDNAVEIALHQIAKDEQSERNSFPYRDKPYDLSAVLEAALGEHFELKRNVARKAGKLGADESDSIMIFHAFRNEVYHIGVKHEAILPALAELYFKTACEFLCTYKPRWLSYNPRMTLPERARKYFPDETFSGGRERFQAACKTLGGSVTVIPSQFAGVLAAHMDEVIRQQDVAVHMIATGGPQTYSRDEAVVQTFAWKIAFTDEGKKFAEKGWRKRSVAGFVDWIGDHYPLPIRNDPILGWRKRADNIRHEKSRTRRLKNIGIL